MSHVDISKHKHKIIGGVDEDTYRVNSNIWLKAQNVFWKYQTRLHTLYFDAWQIALHEALNEDPVSPGYTQRQYRGARLLSAIENLGPDEAAFKFCAEEVDNPDLLKNDDHDLTIDPSEAQEARRERISASKDEIAFDTQKVRDHAKTLTRTLSDKDDDLQKSGVAFTKPAFTSPAQSGFRRPEPSVSNFVEEAADNIEMSTVAAGMLADLISDEPVTNDPQTPLCGNANVTFSEAEEVIWTADRNLNLDEVQAEIFPVIQNYDFSGRHTVRLTVRCWVDGSVEEYSFGKHDVSAADIKCITERLKNDRVLDDEFQSEEYVR